MKMVEAPGSMRLMVIGLIVAVSLFTPVSTWARTNSPGAASGGIDPTPRPLGARVTGDSLGYAPGEVLVKLSSPASIKSENGTLTASSPELSEALRCFGLTKAEEIAPGEYKLSAPQGANVDVAAAAAALNATGAVSYAGPNHLYHAMITPNDEQYVAG